MKRITYLLQTTASNVNQEPESVPILLEKSIICADDALDANMELAKSEAYSGNINVEDCESEVEATNEELLERDVAELLAALNMILTGVVE